MSCRVHMSLFIFICLLILPCFGSSKLNDRPIIGVLAMQINSSSAPNATSYMMASYVKHMESSGARVVPIMIDKPKKYYQDLMSKINGLLLPGGSKITQKTGYGKAGKIMFEFAVEMNDKGDYFPMWGTCLGMELLNNLAIKKNWLKSCAAIDLLSSINFTEGYEKSRMFKDLDSSMKKIMENQNVTVDYHKWCFTPENYTKSNLDGYFKVLATNKDHNGMTFIAAVEAFKYPFYGVMFHPEKIPFEWVKSKKYKSIPHTPEAVLVAQYFSNFFVNEARKNKHRFPSKEAEDAVLIYNYDPIFTGKKKDSKVTQSYYF